MVTVQFVRKRKLREEYALLWLAASGAILTLSLFGGISLFLRPSSASAIHRR